MKRILLLGTCFALTYFPLFGQSGTQTNTANIVNEFGDAYQHYWKTISANLLQFDDDNYAESGKLSKGRRALPMILRDFQFSIPTGATIDNIVVTVRRFKTGKGSVHDLYATLQIPSTPFPRNYGIRWTYTTPYPEIESEFTYSQPGTGTNGGLGTTPFTWTPALINDPYFGFVIDIDYPTKSVAVKYDQVKITVNYTVPAIPTQVRSGRTPIKEPVVFPNPFTSTTLLQFSAAETGNAIIEVFDIAGRKCETIFSQNVIEGQLYTATAGGNTLTKGIYFYRINNGSQSYTGKMVKLE